MLRLTKTFALICSSVHVYLGTDDVTKGREHLSKFSIPKLLRKVVNEEVTPLGAWNGMIISCVRSWVCVVKKTNIKAAPLTKSSHNIIIIIIDREWQFLQIR